MSKLKSKKIVNTKINNKKKTYQLINIFFKN